METFFFDKKPIRVQFFEKKILKYTYEVLETLKIRILKVLVGHDVPTYTIEVYNVMFQIH